MTEEEVENEYKRYKAQVRSFSLQGLIAYYDHEINAYNRLKRKALNQLERITKDLDDVSISNNV